MNSILNKNLKLFKERFSQLYNSLKIDSVLQSFSFTDYEIIKTKSGDITVKENSLLYHSLYNPIKEAEKQISAFNETSFSASVFYSCGLAYSVNAFARQFPKSILVLIEPDIKHFLLSMSFTDWTDAFHCNSLILLINATTPEVMNILNKIGIDKCFFYSVAAQTKHAEKYFSSLEELKVRNIQKKNINDRTLEKFSVLWLKNTCKNIDYIAKLSGIKKLQNTAKDKTAVILAAGPSLNKILPYLDKIRNKAILICVDTALKTVLKTKTFPHYVVLTDPQYWNARHIQGLETTESILLTEIAAWPGVFSFKCKSILLTSSQYPVGKYIEAKTDDKGKLDAGGTVASTAFEFAHFLGCAEIYIAGLDLGFPEKQTHAKGCQFEENVFRNSSRFNTSECFNAKALLGAYPFISKNYQGNDILTDKRMSMYAWWFESKCAQYPELNVYTLTPQSLFIPGIKPFSLDDFLKKENIDYKIPELKISENIKQKLDLVISELLNKLSALYESCSIASKICNRALKKIIPIDDAMEKLKTYDEMLTASDINEVISLVFPTEKQLEEKYESITETNPIKMNLEKSKIIYSELMNSINLYLKYLKKASR